MGKAGKLLRLIIIVLVVVLVGIILFRIRFNDAIRALAQTQVTNTTSDLINDAIDRQIEDGVSRGAAPQDLSGAGGAQAVDLARGGSEEKTIARCCR